MKKVLCLSLIACSIFSSQLDIVKFENRVDRFQEKLLQRDFINKDYTNKVRIESTSVFVPHQLGSLELYHDKDGFYVQQDNKKHKIQKCFTASLVRSITKEQLKTFQEVGYFTLNQESDGQFSLDAKGRINGGGPLFGGFMYWVTKSLCYGILVAATGLAIMGGGSVGVSTKSPTTRRERCTGAAQNVAVELVTVGAGYVASTATVPLSSTVVTTGSKIISTAVVGGSTVGIGLVSTAITGAGFAPEAAALAGAGVSSTAGTGLGVAASIELLSLKVGLFFGMMPTV